MMFVGGTAIQEIVEKEAWKRFRLQRDSNFCHIDFLSAAVNVGSGIVV